MFKTLGNNLQKAAQLLGKQAFLTEETMQEGMSLVRRSLLEADVALPVVQGILQQVKERAIGTAIDKKTTASQMFVRIMQAELTQALGLDATPLKVRATPPVVIMLAGLQGVGKTTTAAKLAVWIAHTHKKQVMLAGCDLARPAAIEQLDTLAKKVGALLFCPPIDAYKSVKERALAAKKQAENTFCDVLIVDTAGRSAMDDALMEELSALHKALNPIETLLVIDAMMGQSALLVADAFGRTLDLTGLILSKADSDTRGGAALSAKHITGKPIKFIGQGEAMDALHMFHPDRIANRILGLGDMTSLLEEADKKLDSKKQLALGKKLKAGGLFSLEDFRSQIDEMNKMGGMSTMLEKLPFGGANARVMEAQQATFRRFAVMIDSMTHQERRNPDILNPSRKQRIAVGSGHQLHHVNSLLKQFKQMQKMMKKASKPGGIKNMQRMMQSLQGASHG